MKLGLVTAIFPELSLQEVLEFAAGEGFSCLEVMCWPMGKVDRKYGGVTHIDVTKFTKAQADDVRALLETYQVGISALGYYPNILCADREQSKFYVDHLKKMIKAAKLLGLTGINTFIGADPALNLEENFAKFLKIWPAIVRFAEEQEIRIGIENCAMYFTYEEWPFGKNMAHSPAVWRRMFEALPSPCLGLNYDPSHPCWMQMDYLKPIGEFAGKLFHVHAKDAKLDREKFGEVGPLALPTQYFQYRIPGYGDVNWDQFFSKLVEVGYDGPVCLEVEDEGFGKSLEGRKRSVKVARNMLAKYFAE